MPRARPCWAIVVEDEPLPAKALSRMLRRRSFSVRVATTTSEALEALATTKPLRLVLAELRIPGPRSRPKYGGLDVLEKVACRHPDVPRAALTGVSDRAVAAQVTALGALFIDKSDAVEKLAALVERAAAHPIAIPLLAHHVMRTVRDRRLTASEAAVLCWLVAGRARDDYCAEHAVSAATFDWHVDQLRAKFDGCPRIHDIVAGVLRDLIARMVRPERLHSTQ